MQDFIIKTVEFAVRPPDVDTSENKGDHEQSEFWSGTDYRPFRLCVAGARRQHFTFSLASGRTLAASGATDAGCMMLADDPGCTLVEPIGAHKSELKKLYEGELMQGGGPVSYTHLDVYKRQAGHYIWLAVLYLLAGAYSGKNPWEVLRHYGPAYLTAVGKMCIRDSLWPAVSRPSARSTAAPRSRSKKRQKPQFDGNVKNLFENCAFCW